MMIGRMLRGNVVQALVLQLGTTGAASAFAIITARILGPTDRGNVVLGLVCVQMAAQFGTLGLNQEGRTLAASNGVGVAYSGWGERRTLVLGAATAFAVIIAGAALRPDNLHLLFLALTVVLTATVQAMTIVLRDMQHGAGNHRLAQTSDLAMWVTALAALAALLATGRANGLTCMGALLVSVITQQAILVRTMSREKGKTLALPVHVASFFSNIGQYALMRTDKLLVGALVGATALGNYSVASTLAEVAWIPCVLLSQVAARAAAQRNRRRLTLVRQVAMAFSAMWCAAIIIGGAPLIEFIFGPSFDNAAAYLAPRAVSAAIYGCVYIDIAVLVSTGAARVASVIGWLGVGATAACVVAQAWIGLTYALWCIAAVALCVAFATRWQSRLVPTT